MKAIIMAGGQGTRGRPYSEYFPKAMTPVRDKPLIDHIVRYVESFEFVNQVVVITDLAGLGGQIHNYYGADDPAYDSGRIAFVQDSQSGTGGDLLHASGLIPPGEPFVLWFADNLCAVDLAGMYRQFRDMGSTACIATRAKRAEETGFAAVDDDGVVLKFIEKPVMDLPLSECLGVYILRHGVLSRISDAMDHANSEMRATSKAGGDGGDDDGGGGGRDTAIRTQINLSHDILQGLSEEGAISAFDIGDAQWVDVESPVILERKKDAIRDILSEMTRARAGAGAS